MEAIISIENVSKVFNPGMPDEMKALSDISMHIRAGEVAVIKGPSGSGKTTLLSLMGCMARPTEGKITVRGRDAAKLPERFLTGIRQNMFGFIFQQFNLIRDFSVIENVMLPLYPVEIKYSDMRARAEAILDKLNIIKKMDLKVQRLSGGEQQRVAIARALMNDPEIVFADEPTAHLDSRLSEELISILNSIKSDGRTIVMATHDPLMYESSIVDCIIEMRDGKVKNVSRR